MRRPDKEVFATSIISAGDDMAIRLLPNKPTSPLIQMGLRAARFSDVTASRTRMVFAIAIIANGNRQHLRLFHRKNAQLLSVRGSTFATDFVINITSVGSDTAILCSINQRSACISLRRSSEAQLTNASSGHSRPGRATATRRSKSMARFAMSTISFVSACTNLHYHSRKTAPSIPATIQPV
jgi:hypothetical protein